MNNSYNRNNNNNNRTQPNNNYISSPFGDDDGMFGNPFNMFQKQMSAFDNVFSKMDSFMNTDATQVPRDGNTQYYCSSVSTTVLPNGVVETKKQTRTNDREEKEHFKQIGDKRVVGKYSKDLISGKEDIRRDMYNLKEDEVDMFDQEFNKQQQQFQQTWGNRALHQDHQNTNHPNNYNQSTSHKQLKGPNQYK